MNPQDKRILYGMAVAGPLFGFCDAAGRDFVLIPFISCDPNTGHRAWVITVPQALMESRPPLLEPGQPVTLQGVADPTGKRFTVSDARIVPETAAA